MYVFVSCLFCPPHIPHASFHTSALLCCCCAMRSSTLFGLLALADGCNAFSFVHPSPLSGPTASTAITAVNEVSPESMSMSSSGPVSRRALLTSGATAVATVGLWIAAAGGSPRAANAAQRVGSGGPPFSQSGYDLSPLTPDEVGSRVDKLTELQKTVLVQAGTERPFQGKTVNGYSGATKAEGTWVSAVSGVPLFSSKTKFDSGTGWPSFYAPIDPEHVIERVDPKDAAGMPKFLQRVEVLDRKSGTHLGHVFDDGPRPTGKRYCMNAASMAFIPKEEPLPVKPSYTP